VLTVAGVVGANSGSCSGHDWTRAWLVLLVPNLGRLRLVGSPAPCDNKPAGAVKCDDSAAAAADEVGSVILRGVVAICDGRGGFKGFSGMGVGPTIVEDLLRLGDTGRSGMSLCRLYFEHALLTWHGARYMCLRAARGSSVAHMYV